MKRIKVSLLAVIISIIVVAIFQNQDFFMNKQTLNIDLYFFDYTTPPLPNILMFFSSFIVGLLTVYISYISYKLKLNKIIKLLRSRETSLMKLVSSLKQELEEIKMFSGFRERKDSDLNEFQKEKEAEKSD